MFDEAVAQKDDVPFFYNNLGIAYENMTQYREAATAYQHALDIQPEYPKARMNFRRIQNHLQNVSSVYQEE